MMKVLRAVLILSMIILLGESWVDGIQFPEHIKELLIPKMSNMKMLKNTGDQVSEKNAAFWMENKERLRNLRKMFYKRHPLKRSQMAGYNSEHFFGNLH